MVRLVETFLLLFHHVILYFNGTLITLLYLPCCSVTLIYTMLESVNINVYTMLDSVNINILTMLDSVNINTYTMLGSVNIHIFTILDS